MSNDPYERNKNKKCSVCNNIIMLDKFGYGVCKHCGWIQTELAEFHPNEVVYPNIVAFNRAKQLVEQTKLIKPTFEEFMEGYEQWGEMELYYKNHRYGLITLKEGEISFYEWGVKGTVQTHKVSDFMNNGHINGTLLKDIWNEIENAYYIQG